MKKLKVLSIILAVLSLSALMLTVILYVTRENEKERRLEVEELNVQITEEKGLLQQEVARLEDIEKELNRKYVKSVKEKQEVEERLGAVQTEKQESVEQLSRIQKQLEKVRSDYQAYKEKASEIVKDFKEQNERLIKHIDELKSRVSGVDMGATSNDILSSSKYAPQSAASSGPSGVQLPTVVVNPKESEAGKVVVINEKYQFFICNLGSADGIHLKDKVSVFKDNTLIATAEVEKIYDNLSACGILKQNKQFTINEGDIVRVE